MYSLIMLCFFFYANQLFMLITNLIFNKLFFGTLVLVSDSQVDHASKPDIRFYLKKALNLT